jgi:hypothetical protein
MTSDRRLRANRANAKSSIGPKTAAGKARTAQNALRHGLNISIWSDDALAPQAEAVARRIAGPNTDAETLERARRIGEAQVDLNRVRARCRGLLVAGMFAQISAINREGIAILMVEQNARAVRFALPFQGIARLAGKFWDSEVADGASDS